MRIIKATYGDTECTNQIESKIIKNKLIVRSNNDIIGDTRPGVIKYLKIEIEHEGLISNHQIKEGDLFIFPKSTNKKLGIFYSNNNNPLIYPTIKKSLKYIEKASKDKADILTCMWQKEPDNPFQEYIAWTQTCSHLNQLLQIMQLLYQAREIGDYEYVSFLEHDVLYPEGYFDFPDFDYGIIITNMNYMGMNSSGFQPLGQQDQPFHQMTMKFKDAINHCESILSNALVTNSGLIEPKNLIRQKWDCVNPAIHVNHGHHFTSHFNIYTNEVFDYDNYWGNYKDIWMF
jgi:hypothetical protein